MSCLPLERIVSNSSVKWSLKSRFMVKRTPKYLYGLLGGRNGMCSPVKVVSLFSSCLLRRTVCSFIDEARPLRAWRCRIPVTAHFLGLSARPPHLQ